MANQELQHLQLVSAETIEPALYMAAVMPEVTAEALPNDDGAAEIVYGLQAVANMSPDEILPEACATSYQDVAKRVLGAGGCILRVTVSVSGEEGVADASLRTFWNAVASRQAQDMATATKLEEQDRDIYARAFAAAARRRRRLRSGPVAQPRDTDQNV